MGNEKRVILNKPMFTKADPSDPKRNVYYGEKDQDITSSPLENQSLELKKTALEKLSNTPISKANSFSNQNTAFRQQDMSSFQPTNKSAITMSNDIENWLKINKSTPFMDKFLRDAHEDTDENNFNSNVDNFMTDEEVSDLEKQHLQDYLDWQRGNK